MNNYMFDTNVFNEILDQSIDVSSIGNATFYVTHIQLNEIQATSNLKRKKQLLNIFREVETKAISTETAVWDVSEWGNAKWGSANGMYQPIVDRLGALNKKKKNNIQDSLIAETAIINKQILVTNDRDLQQVVGEFGGNVIDFSTFLACNA